MIDNSLASVIENAVEDYMSDVHTGFPVKVQSVDTTLRTVEVVPQMARTLKKDNGEIVDEKLPNLVNVPIAMLRSSMGFFFYVPIEVGSFGRIVCCEYSIRQWLALGKECNPADSTKFNLDGALFIPDLNPNTNLLPDILTDDPVVGISGKVQARFKEDSLEVVSNGAPSATDFVAMASKVDMMFDLINTIFTNWAPVPQDGGASLKAAWTAAWTAAQATASSNLKADI